MVPLILDQLGTDARLRNVVGFGFGYGTFTMPVARRISDTVTTFDLDEAMIERTRQRGGGGGGLQRAICDAGCVCLLLLTRARLKRQREVVSWLEHD